MPTPTQHLLAQVRDAYAHHAPLWVQGGGSKRFHVPAVPQVQVQVLDVTPLQGVVGYTPSELVVTVGAGTPLAQLRSVLAAQGQCLPFDPPHFSAEAPCNATVGGMVAAGWSGPARASVGCVRDYVLGVEMVNGRGQLLRFGGQVMKNVAGYDISRLMVGSWGCLGVLTEVSLKVLPVPAGDATLRMDCTQAQALQRLQAWRSQPLPLHASTWWPVHGSVGAPGALGISSPFGESGNLGSADSMGQLYLRLRGAEAAVQAACRSLGGERMEPAQAQRWWADCRDHSLPWFALPSASLPHTGVPDTRAPDTSTALWRLSVPATAPPAPVWDGVAAPLLEWHGAQRWVHAPLAHGPQLRAWARSVGGRAVLFRAAHADAITAWAPFDCEDPVLQALHQRVKQAFDPAGILNPGGVPESAP